MSIMKVITKSPQIIPINKTILPAVNSSNMLKQLPLKSLESERPVSEVCSKILKSLAHSEMIVAKTFLTDRDSNLKRAAYITKFERQNKKFLYIKDDGIKNLGYIVLEKPQGGMFNFPMGEDYIYNSMEATALETVNRGCGASVYRGIGTELLKAAVNESKKSGYGGRLYLMAYDSHPPTPFYYKCGLRFLDGEKNKLMQEYIERKAKGVETELIESIRQGLMYLPEENINSLLAK